MANIRRIAPPFAAAIACFALATGCVNITHLPDLFAPPSPDKIREKYLDIGTVGDITEVANGADIQVSGVGLVVGLDGTGGSPPGEFRTMLEQQLRKQKIEHARALLDNPNNALVLVSARLPAGVRKGELLDVQITLPQGSKATSLKGGILTDCPLRNYENQRNLDPEAANKLLPGHVLARAKGPLLVGLGNTEDQSLMRVATIWSGATSFIERPFYFVLTKETMERKDMKDKGAKVANAIAARINLQFQDDPRKQKVLQETQNWQVLDETTRSINRSFDTGGKDIARASGKEVITVRVPYAYRFNPGRFLLVSRQLPLSVPPEVLNTYRGKLDGMLLEPKQTMRAALRLEALGRDSIPILKKGLGSSDPLVRFCSAESLTYLNSTAGVEDLAKLSITQPDLRAYAMMAIAGLDESICRQKLNELLTIDDPELRSSAFRALYRLDETDPRLGEEVVGPFSLHKVAGGSASAVTFSMNRRAEIVLFGPEATLKTPIKVWAGSEFTITAEPNDNQISVSRISAKGTLRKLCPMSLEATLRAIVELGGGYPEAVDLLRNLHEHRILSCQIREAAPTPAVSLDAILAADLKEAKLPLTD